MPVHIGLDYSQIVYEASQPDVMLIDVYPCAWTNEIGDFSMTGFGYPNVSFVNYIRTITSFKPPETPVWIILQTHQYHMLDGNPAFWLRVPNVSEVREQQWLSIGEGITGIFWFMYGTNTEYGWAGLEDNYSLFTEVADGARRLEPLRSKLLGLKKTADLFTATSASKAPYISTLAGDDGLYAVVVNTDCSDSAKIRISSPYVNGRFVDCEDTTITIASDSAISLRPGDGRFFKMLVPKIATQRFTKTFIESPMHITTKKSAPGRLVFSIKGVATPPANLRIIDAQGRRKKISGIDYDPSARMLSCFMDSRSASPGLYLLTFTLQGRSKAYPITIIR
jgi:hypothetical protein